MIGKIDAMTRETWGRIGTGAVFLLAILLIYAWIDGGREPVREMVHPVPVPEEY